MKYKKKNYDKMKYDKEMGVTGLLKNKTGIEMSGLAKSDMCSMKYAKDYKRKY